MKKNTNIDYYEEELPPKEDIELWGSFEFSEFIEDRISQNSKNKLFKKQTNEYIDAYNTKFGKTYSKIS